MIKNKLALSRVLIAALAMSLMPMHAQARDVKPTMSTDSLVKTFLNACAKKLGQPKSNESRLGSAGFIKDPKPRKGKAPGNLVHKSLDAEALVVSFKGIYSCEVSARVARPKSVKRRDFKKYVLTQAITAISQVQKQAAPKSKLLGKKGGGYIAFKQGKYTYEFKIVKGDRIRILVSKFDI